MRNWNYFGADRIEIMNGSFQTTYEELKLRLHNIFSFKTQVSRLPMRNWNPRKRNKRGMQYRVSRLPMRNWNSGKKRWKEPEVHVSRLPMRNWNSTQAWIEFKQPQSFQTTYEELKHGLKSVNVYIASLFPDYLWGIETFSGKWIWILTLPKFPDYLWGIETTKQII